LRISFSQAKKEPFRKVKQTNPMNGVGLGCLVEMMCETEMMMMMRTESDGGWDEDPSHLKDD